jgi:hypothetical protein
MNRLQLRDLARKKLGETTGAFWTDAEINAFINDACRDASAMTKCVKGVVTISTSDCTANATVAGTNETTLTAIDPAMYSVTEVYFNSDNRWSKLTPKTIVDMDTEYPGWRDTTGRTYTDPSTGTVTYNYGSTPGIPFLYYWSSELNLFGWYPATDTDNTTSDNMKLYITKRHADILSDAESPTIPEPLHLALIDFVAATGYETRGQIERANDYWNKYRQRLLTYMSERNKEQEDDGIVQMRNYRNI